jgi:hypothetical protein
MFAMLIVLIVIISRLPNDNPLKIMLTALSYRVGATVAAGALAIPIEPVPGMDAIYDVAVPLGLLYYWFTFFRGAYRSIRPAPPTDPTRRFGR